VRLAHFGLPLVAGGAVRVTALALLAVAVAALFVVLGRIARPAGPDARLNLLSHLEELRRRLLASGLALVLGVLFALSFRFEAWHGVWLPRPALYDPMAAQAYHAVANDLVPPGVQLIATRPVDAFMAEVWMALAIGFAFALPVILVQLGAFVAPALRPRERRMVWRAVAPSVALFFGGAAFAYFLVLPATLRALYAFTGPIGAIPYLQVSELPTFALGFLLAFGIGFQLPIVLYLLARIGLMTARGGLRRWRVAVLVIVVLSAFLTPDPTLVSQVMMAGPLVLLYFAGLGLARIGERRFAAAETGP
ncbi:MAG TPA: twin-arginine translocase subunit TatC, partial [Candidatus Thermoplasmatota archaeon]|nr:twin-arginine translocase subunit TatC [Candidatus Thermoplasmatota archaeon]